MEVAWTLRFTPKLLMEVVNVEPRALIYNWAHCAFTEDAVQLKRCRDDRRTAPDVVGAAGA
jgi:hypothetical protein